MAEGRGQATDAASWLGEAPEIDTLWEERAMSRLLVQPKFNMAKSIALFRTTSEHLVQDCDTQMSLPLLAPPKSPSLTISHAAHLLRPPTAELPDPE